MTTRAKNGWVSKGAKVLVPMEVVEEDQSSNRVTLQFTDGEDRGLVKRAMAGEEVVVVDSFVQQAIDKNATQRPAAEAAPAAAPEAAAAAAPAPAEPDK
jgi:hypothetical protein